MTQSGHWVSTSKSAHLRGRKKYDTTPELLLRKALHASGYRFRVHRELAKGCRPDIVLPRYQLAIFVDGCFWHGCPEHGRKTPFTGPNAELWETKMERNRDRDRRATSLGEEAGWRVLRFWECQVRRDVTGCVEQADGAALA